MGTGHSGSRLSAPLLQIFFPLKFFGNCILYLRMLIYFHVDRDRQAPFLVPHIDFSIAHHRGQKNAKLLDYGRIRGVSYVVQERYCARSGRLPQPGRQKWPRAEDNAERKFVCFFYGGCGDIRTPSFDWF